MKPKFRPLAQVTVASSAALFLLSAPFAIDWHALDIDALQAHAKGDGEGKGKGGKDGGESTSGGLGGALGAVGGAIGGAVGAVGDAVGGVADGVGDALGGDTSDSSGEADSDSGSGEASGDSGSGAGSGDSGSGDASGDSDSGASSGESDAGDASGDSGSGAASNSDSGEANSVSGTGLAGDAADGGAPSDTAGETGTADASAPDSDEPEASPDADDGAAPSLTDTVSDAVESVDSAIDDTDEATSEDSPSIDSSTATSAASSSHAAGKGVVSRARVTVSVKTVRLNSARRGGDGDKHRLAGSSGAVSARVTASDDAALGVAAIEPSAGPAVTDAVPPARPAALGCAAPDGRGQGVAMSCHIPGSEDDSGARQVAYAPPDAAIDGGAPAGAIDGPAAPDAGKLPGGRSFYDELYGLQQVEARRYADGGVPVLVVQGIVSNMSDGRRPVPPLLAIVQDEEGKELMRWTFRAEVDALAPGGSTGFRSEMFDPQSQSANVTIVFAVEQQTMR